MRWSTHRRRYATNKTNQTKFVLVVLVVLVALVVLIVLFVLFVHSYHTHTQTHPRTHTHTHMHMHTHTPLYICQLLKRVAELAAELKTLKRNWPAGSESVDGRPKKRRIVTALRVLVRIFPSHTTHSA